MHFRDRAEAGQRLAQVLEKYRHVPAVVYALPRGGVVPGVEIAEHLEAPLDLVIPRKIGHPLNPEYAVCAVTESGRLVCNEREAAVLDPDWLGNAVRAEQAEAERRRRLYTAGRPAIPAEGKTAIITDDGIATGLTMLAAIMDVKDRRPDKVVVAVPIMPHDFAEQLRSQVDDLVALDIPEIYMGAVGAYYDRFDQVEDKEVIQLLNRVRADVEGARRG